MAAHDYSAAAARRVFGHPAFRGAQKAIVLHVTGGGDALAKSEGGFL